MSWLLIADSNEQAHSAAEGVDRRAYLAANTGLECETRPLTVGDYALLWVDGGEEKAVALIERKAMADMVASIKDTRYVSQSQRMEASGVPFLYWAIVNGPASHEDEDRVASALVHLSTPAYPRTRVLRVADSDLSFARAIRSLARYLHDALHKGNALAEAPLHTVAQEAGARPRLDTQPLVWRETLTIPRGMSLRSAKAVAAVHPSAISLLRALRRSHDAHLAAPPPPVGRKRKVVTLDDALDDALVDIPLPGGKKLGPAAARTLRQTLVPNAAELAHILP